jgi:hypothetical protein
MSAVLAPTGRSMAVTSPSNGRVSVTPWMNVGTTSSWCPNGPSSPSNCSIGLQKCDVVNTVLRCQQITGIECHLNAGRQVPQPPVELKWA